MPTADIVIIGGGVVGSSIAFNLLQDGFDGQVTVLERDSSYQFASSALAFGGVRQQFMTPISLKMVQYSLSVLPQFPDCEFHQCGYLFLGDDAHWNELQKRYEIQKSLGVDCELFDVADIQRLVPELNCDDLRGALFGPRDGYVDPRALLRSFRKKAEGLGAKYVSQDFDKAESGPTGPRYA